MPLETTVVESQRKNVLGCPTLVTPFEAHLGTYISCYNTYIEFPILITEGTKLLETHAIGRANGLAPCCSEWRFRQLVPQRSDLLPHKIGLPLPTSTNLRLIMPFFTITSLCSLASLWEQTERS